MATAATIDDNSRLPESVLELEGDDFYRFTKTISGALLTEVLKIQEIDSVFFIFTLSKVYLDFAGFK